MTTKVTISMDSPNHLDAMVETFDPNTGKPWTVGRRLQAGDREDFWVHQGMALRITEVAKVVDVKTE